MKFLTHIMPVSHTDVYTYCDNAGQKTLFERVVHIANINQLARPSVTTFGGGQHYARAPPDNDVVGIPILLCGG